jgi:predicted Zn-ribbon and HTH transcriptional regulator
MTATSQPVRSRGLPCGAGEVRGPSHFQRKAVEIIRVIHGDDSADELAAKYANDNLIKEIEEAEEYTLAELVPIPAKCAKCKRNWLGRDAIRAPSLDNCRCFYCGGQLKPHPKFPVVDAKTKRHGLFDVPGAAARGGAGR